MATNGGRLPKDAQPSVPVARRGHRDRPLLRREVEARKVEGAQDGALLGNLTRIFVETVHAFYAERAAGEGALGAKTGAVTVVQRAF